MTEGGVLSNILDVISEALQVVTVAIGLGFILIKPFSQVFWHSPSWCQGVRTKWNSKGVTYMLTPQPSLLPLQLASSFGQQPLVEWAFPLHHEAFVAGRWHLASHTWVDETLTPIFLTIWTFHKLLVDGPWFHLDYLIWAITGIPTLVIVIGGVVAKLIGRLVVGTSSCSLAFDCDFRTGWRWAFLGFLFWADGLICSPFSLGCSWQRSWDRLWAGWEFVGLLCEGPWW